MEKIGRNDLCTCHSGLKFKKCCGRAAEFDADGYNYRAHIPLNDGSAPEVGTKEGSLIVKVQTALNDASAPAMIYDRARAFQRFVPSQEVLGRMAGRPKAYFYAELKYGQLVLGEEAPAQGW